jgi:hypothetical protein
LNLNIIKGDLKMKCLISTYEGKNLAALCNWRDSIWKLNELNRRKGNLGYNASLYTADLDYEYDHNNDEAYLTIDGKRFDGFLYVNKINGKFHDEEYEDEVPIFLWMD